MGYEARRPGDIPQHSSRKASVHVLSHLVQGDSPCLQEIHARSHGSLCGRRGQTDPTWSSTKLLFSSNPYNAVWLWPSFLSNKISLLLLFIVEWPKRNVCLVINNSRISKRES